ncbi:hypothetical protein ACFT9M_22330 [Micromonospora purpureochromogenes]|uniref:hypothetical protein n=1 Tax=Micromonospora purpureochromogenes TaxID=47872 RepID=UPI00364505E7
MSPRSVRAARRKFVVLVGLTVVALLSGLPAPTVVALALTGLAVPVAVALAGGRPRDLLPSRPARRGGLGHTQEQGERFVT